MGVYDRNGVLDEIDMKQRWYWADLVSIDLSIMRHDVLIGDRLPEQRRN